MRTFNSQAKIESTKNIQLLLQSPYTDNQEIKLTSEIITNKIYTDEEEKIIEEATEEKETVKSTKRMIQTKITSGLKENQYPIKETKIKLTVPEEVEKIEVSSQGTKATNGKTDLSWEKRTLHMFCQNYALLSNII